LRVGSVSAQTRSLIPMMWNVRSGTPSTMGVPISSTSLPSHR
jgi:hypothetical protein